MLSNGGNGSINGKYSKPISTFFPACSNPDDLRSQFDLCDQLSQSDRALYTGKECLAAYNLPTIITTSIKRIQPQISIYPPVSVNACLACCVSHGVTVISQSSTVKDYLEASYGFFCEEDRRVDSTKYQMVVDWFEQFPFDVMISRGGNKKQVNISVTEPIRNAVSDISASLSIPKSTIIVISLLVSLQDHEHVLADHQTSMRQSVIGFMEGLELRTGLFRVASEWANRRA